MSWISPWETAVDACIERRSPLDCRVSIRPAVCMWVLTQTQTRARRKHGSSCSDKARGHSPEVPYHRTAHLQPPLVVVGDPRHVRLDTPSTFSRPSPFPRAASRAAASDWSRAPHGRLAAFRAAPRFYRSVDATFLVLLFPSSPAILPLPLPPQRLPCDSTAHADMSSHSPWPSRAAIRPPPAHLFHAAHDDRFHALAHPSTYSPTDALLR